MRAARSYCASSDPRVHMGLGDVTAVERVVVRWVGGALEEFGPFGVDVDLILRRGEGRER